MLRIDCDGGYTDINYHCQKLHFIPNEDIQLFAQIALTDCNDSNDSND